MASFDRQSIFPPLPYNIRLAFVSTYPPRRCGIGTYTKDLATGINNLNPERLAEIIALDDSISQSLEYPWEVSRRIRQQEWGDYQRVLRYLNHSVIDMVSIQHEFGIFGGPDGEYIVRFAQELEKPFIVTFHTVLQRPSENQKRIIQELAHHAQAVVVMLSVAGDILRDVYDIDPAKVVPIHHGTPDFPFAHEEAAKSRLGLEDRIIMSNVNLISRGKGIEYALQALPKVVAQYPNFLYLIVGQTHPVVQEQEGEAYREMLTGLVNDLGLQNHVQFVNEYVSLEALIGYVEASDFYITPYENLEQISSGSLAYAVAAGKLCLSTPYRYAQEILAGGHGYLVAPRSPESIRDALLHALSHPQAAENMRFKSYAQGRKMVWVHVAFRHLHVMHHLLQTALKPAVYSPPTLRYLRFLTDEWGLLEHSHHDGRNFVEGYATDDNARMLIVATQYNDRRLAEVALKFLCDAERDGKFYCDRDENGEWINQPGIGDWFGRAFWAAAYALQYSPSLKIRRSCAELVRRMLPVASQVTAMRTSAYILLGLSCLDALEWDEYGTERAVLLQQMVNSVQGAFASHTSHDWVWPEPILAYDNPRIAQALIEVGMQYKRDDIKQLGLQLIDFVLDHTFDIQQNHFRFIGNKGWYKKGETKTLFDEQPIEAGATVQACEAAYRATGIRYYRDMACKAFAWYHGDNILRRPLYNSSRGSVYDGLGQEAVNLNQGAESILEYLLAYTAYAKLVSEGPRDQTNSTASIRTITSSSSA